MVFHLKAFSPHKQGPWILPVFITLRLQRTNPCVCVVKRNTHNILHLLCAWMQSQVWGDWRFDAHCTFCIFFAGRCLTLRTCRWVWPVLHGLFAVAAEMDQEVWRRQWNLELDCGEHKGGCRCRSRCPGGGLLSHVVTVSPVIRNALNATWPSRRTEAAITWSAATRIAKQSSAGSAWVPGSRTALPGTLQSPDLVLYAVWSWWTGSRVMHLTPSAFILLNIHLFSHISSVLMHILYFLQ